MCAPVTTIVILEKYIYILLLDQISHDVTALLTRDGHYLPHNDSGDLFPHHISHKATSRDYKCQKNIGKG